MKHDFDLGRKVCRTCGKRIKFVRASRIRKAFWSHVTYDWYSAYKAEHHIRPGGR